jgi:hypothetical protein
VRGTKACADGSTGNLVELNFALPSASTPGRTDLWVGDGAQIMRCSFQSSTPRLEDLKTSV